MYVRSSLNSHYASFKPEFTESVWCEIQLQNRDKLIVGCIYRSPNSCVENNNLLNASLKKVTNESSHILIMGDLNHPEIDWKSGTTPPDLNHRASKFMEALRDSFLHQHVTQPTHIRGEQTPHVLDLVLTNESNMIQSIEHNAPLGKSHHQILNFEFKAYTSIKQNNTQKLNLHKGDYPRLNTEINRTDWENIIGALDANQAWKKVEEILEPLIENTIPKRKPPRQSKPPPKWMNGETSKKIKQKREAYSKYLQTRSQEDYDTYARYRNQVKSSCRKAMREFTKSLATEVKQNPKAFYSYVRSRTKTKGTIPDLKDDTGTLVNKDEAKAEVLNNYFTSVFTIDNDQHKPIFQDRNFDRPLLTSNFTKDAVKKKLQQLKPNKSPGPDTHHPRIFKEISDSIAEPLSKVFNKSLDEGKLPNKWKQANITPIFKKGEKDKPSNYRPVSLTSIVCKVMETIIRDLVVEHMTRNNLFSHFQHGFIKGRSCVTNLLAVLDAWTEAIDKGLPVDTAYLDLAKAFDKVSHQKLLHKIWGYGIRGKVYEWIEDFLHDRVQRVLLNGKPSKWNKVSSGVPQGSVLGPILFVIFVNDLPEETNSIAQMFADDTKLYRTIKDQCDQKQLQKDIDALATWARTWKLEFNASKCKILHIGNNNLNYNYTMEDGNSRRLLEPTILEKDLGTFVDPDLKFSQHIETQVNKANKILGMIRRTFEYMDAQVMKRLYTSLVRPHLEFNNTAWSPRLAKDQKLLEGVQRRATRLVPGLKHLEYEERLRRMDLPSLYYRRLRGDMIETYKHLHNQYTTNKNLLQLHGQSRTRGHSLKLTKKYCRTSLRKNYFSYRVVDIWNDLPEHIVRAKSTNAFKAKIDRHFRNIMYSIEPQVTAINRNTHQASERNNQDDDQERLTGNHA